MKKFGFLVLAFFAFINFQCECEDENVIDPNVIDPNNRCTWEPNVGPCNAAIPRYYFDKMEMKCKQFIWGGCAGVVPFETLEECKQCE